MLNEEWIKEVNRPIREKEKSVWLLLWKERKRESTFQHFSNILIMVNMVKFQSADTLKSN